MQGMECTRKTHKGLTYQLEGLLQLLATLCVSCVLGSLLPGQGRLQSDRLGAGAEGPTVVKTKRNDQEDLTPNPRHCRSIDASPAPSPPPAPPGGVVVPDEVKP